MSSVSSDLGVSRDAAFDFVRYGSVWEDADVLCEALEPVARGQRILSIASAGDNALALLTLDPAQVVAVDLSPAQLACVALRREAFRRLEYPDLLAFLGVMPATHRDATYRSLRLSLPAEAAAFWDAHPDAIANGCIHAGKFERYFTTFRRFVLPLVHGAVTVRSLRAARSTAEQREFYASRWDTWRWRALFRVFFSRFVMGRLGRDPAFFAHVKGSVAGRILDRTRHALTEIPVAGNPYLCYILTGNFAVGALPRYLRPEFHAVIRDRLDRIQTRLGPAEAVEGSFSGFNLSDIFEYMTGDEHRRVHEALLDRATPGARLVYWNMLAPRSLPEALRARAHPLESLAKQLHARDQAWFYQRLYVDEVAGAAR